MRPKLAKRYVESSPPKNDTWAGSSRSRVIVRCPERPARGWRLAGRGFVVFSSFGANDRDAKKSDRRPVSKPQRYCRAAVQHKIFRRLRQLRPGPPLGCRQNIKARLECAARISRRFARGSPDCSGVAKRAVRATSPSVALSLSWLPDRRRGPLLRYKTRAKSSRPCRHRSAASRPS
jgi:hypothetical protein